MNWLVVSLLASVVMTVVLNVAIRLWPNAAERQQERVEDWAQRQDSAEVGRGDGGVRVIVPWKAMLLASIGLTILLNVIVRLA